MSKYSEKIAQKERGFYRVADFEGDVKEVTHTIAYLLEDQVVFDEEKDILVFSDTGRQLQVSVANAKILIDLFGDEPDGWAGQKVTLYVGSYGKQNKPCIRLKALGAPAQVTADILPKPIGGNGAAKESGAPAPFDDEIPF